MNTLVSMQSLYFAISIIARFAASTYAMILSAINMTGNDGKFSFLAVIDQSYSPVLLIIIIITLFYEFMFWLSTRSILFNQSIATKTLFISHYMPYVTGLMTCIIPSLIEFTIFTNVILLNIIEIIAFGWISYHYSAQRVQ